MKWYLPLVLLLPLAVVCGCGSRAADSEPPPGVQKNPAPAPPDKVKGSKPHMLPGLEIPDKAHSERR